MANCEIIELHRNSLNWAKIVEEIVRIEKKVFPKHESLAKSFEEEAKKRNGGLIYSLIGGQVAGYVMYSWPSSLYACITKLAVKENCRGKGHGEALLKAAIEKCKTRKIHRISLHVDPLRTAAMTLYKKLGFEVDSLVESYYSSVLPQDSLELASSSGKSQGFFLRISAFFKGICATEIAKNRM
ncbi:L-methionine sulfoximine/L-methionine sulfone acetyltransferase isoform X1 [Salvia hispanica]|uniref:L-methionine sulfoximine/L-methionine sulfone acetyltransferase isoform X1 n=1 Tax=Salvia hispanica TaxID=49212 RepID=UPI002009D6E6|nr:L-methionine sulfoximine/L-methionine sulfone acetyltransferase isoform X1 [Salvia hispanica]